MYLDPKKVGFQYGYGTSEHVYPWILVTKSPCSMGNLEPPVFQIPLRFDVLGFFWGGPNTSNPKVFGSLGKGRTWGTGTGGNGTSSCTSFCKLKSSVDLRLTPHGTPKSFQTFSSNRLKCDCWWILTCFSTRLFRHRCRHCKGRGGVAFTKGTCCAHVTGGSGRGGVATMKL